MQHSMRTRNESVRQTTSNWCSMLQAGGGQRLSGGENIACHKSRKEQGCPIKLSSLLIRTRERNCRAPVFFALTSIKNPLQPLRASAPPTISEISRVMPACRARLSCRVKPVIILPALSVAEFIAVILAPCSLATDSKSA